MPNFDCTRSRAAHDKPRPQCRRVEQATDPGGERDRILLGDHQCGRVVNRNLADRAGVGGHAGDAYRHRLQQRLRHAFIGVGRQGEDVERAQPRRHVLLRAGQTHRVAKPEGADLRLDRWRAPDRRRRSASRVSRRVSRVIASTR